MATRHQRVANGTVISSPKYNLDPSGTPAETLWQRVDFRRNKKTRWSTGNAPGNKTE